MVSVSVVDLLIAIAFQWFRIINNLMLYTTYYDYRYRKVYKQSTSNNEKPYLDVVRRFVKLGSMTSNLSGQDFSLFFDKRMQEALWSGQVTIEEDNTEADVQKSIITAQKLKLGVGFGTKQFALQSETDLRLPTVDIPEAFSQPISVAATTSRDSGHNSRMATQREGGLKSSRIDGLVEALRVAATNTPKF